MKIICHFQDILSHRSIIIFSLSLYNIIESYSYILLFSYGCVSIARSTSHNIARKNFS